MIIDKSVTRITTFYTLPFSQPIHLKGINDRNKTCSYADRAYQSSPPRRLVHLYLARRDCQCFRLEGAVVVHVVSVIVPCATTGGIDVPDLANALRILERK